MAQDTLQQAKENYDDAKEAMREAHDRFREDLKFSNPANPEQWDKEALGFRKGRVTLTLDHTNKNIAQIVNDARQNKPSIQVLPADSKADVEVAKRLNGIIRHIEYTSRAGIAYDTALELAARVGLGWIRVIPKVTRPETNEQEILILREHDPLAIVLDANSIEPDGSDAMCGFAETTLTTKAFERMYPKAEKASWDSQGWFGDDAVRVCEYFKVKETKVNRITVAMPDGRMLHVGEDEYWELAKQIGFKPNVAEQFVAKERTVNWYKMTGAEILDETEFPAQYIPLIPVLGYELWIDGKRYLCGMVRRMMDSQRLHNYEMSALAESMRAQPKAPFLVPQRAIDGHVDKWQALNTGNPAFLPWNDVDVDNPQSPVAAPIRLSPPQFPSSYASGATLGLQEMDASVGMYNANRGEQSNAVSGRAKLADQREGDTANFHYIDNLRRSMEHMGRIIVEMIPRIYDTRRQAKIMGEDGEQTAVEIDPQGPAVQRNGTKVVAINPSVGSYDVRVKIGPSYTSMREEISQRLIDLGQGNPPLAAALAPLLVKMSDMPEADKIAKVAIALLPPPVQAAYHEDDETDIPPAVQAKLQAKDQQLEQANALAERAAQVIEDLQEQLNNKNTEQEARLAVAKANLDVKGKELGAQQKDIAAAEQLLAKEVELQQIKIKMARMEAMLDVKEAALDIERTHMEGEKQEGEQKKQADESGLQSLAKAVQEGQAALAKEISKIAAEQPDVNKIIQETAAMLEQKMSMSKPAKVEKIKGKDGKTTAARITNLDGTVREVSIQ